MTTKESETKSLATKEVYENAIKQETKMIKELQDPLLLLHIIDELHKKGVQGEEDTILALINKITLRLVKNSEPTSSNVVVSDKTGSGKDYLVKSVTEVMVPKNDLIHRTMLSEKALNYWIEPWNKKVLYLEDPLDETLQSQIFRVLCSGETEVTTVKDQQRLDLKIEGKPVIIVTTMNSAIDEEGERRWDTVRVDTTEQLTEKIIKQSAQREIGNVETIDTTLLEALHSLQEFSVVIPFAGKIVDNLSDGIKRNSIMRTKIHTLYDYIKSSTVLHQKQRKKDSNGRLIAEPFDYEYGSFVFMKLKDIGCNLTKDEEEFIDMLDRFKNPLSIRECGVYFKRRSKEWIYKHMDTWKTKGLIEESVDRDENANKEITKITTSYKSSSEILPDISVLYGFISNLQDPQQEGYNGCSGFMYIMREINKNRTNNGLSHFLYKTIKTITTPHMAVVNNQNTTINDQEVTFEC